MNPEETILRIKEIKSELFDLSVKMATDRKSYQDKLIELNGLLNKGESNGN